MSIGQAASSPSGRDGDGAVTSTTMFRQGMNAVLDRVVFLKQLHEVSNRIHSTDKLEVWQLGLMQEICDLVRADRMTLYEADANGREIVTKVKLGLNLKDIRLPIDARSVAGYVAMSRRPLNIADAYDAEELRSVDPALHFLHQVDKLSGYRTQQMLVVPLVFDDQLMGVLQFINYQGEGPFPEVMVEGARELARTLAVAMNRRRHGLQLATRSLFDLLIQDGVLTPSALESARRQAMDEGRDVQSVLVSEHQVPHETLGRALSRSFGVPYEPWQANRIKPVELLRNLRLEFCRSNAWLPLEEGPEGLVVLCLDPERTRASRMVNAIFPKREVVYRVTTEPEFTRCLKQFFALEDQDSVTELLSDLGDEDETAPADDVTVAADNELVRLVNRIIVEAHQQGASDIHIEPRPGKAKTVVRFRRDGDLVKYLEIPASLRSALVTRLKIMCDLDISEKRKPQDGKIKFKRFGPLDIELRVATIPTAGGTEDVVMRILASGEALPLEAVGLSAHNLSALKACIGKPYGLFLVCGPTGSGKTTTLHSALKHLNRPETKIWTAEDPVEITQEGLRQVQVNRKAGLDFAAVMRAFLRADPDVIMVGEMRDAETAGTGVEASLTGHLVMSTLHTNSAPESVVRLLDMGLDPFNFADALLGILAQRLARRLCSDCKEAYSPSAAEVEALLDDYSADLQGTPEWQADAAGARARLAARWAQTFAPEGRYRLYRAKGCKQCGDSGYRGRVGLHELMVATEPVKKLVQERARAVEVLRQALTEGMTTLKMDGLEKVMQGITDVHQVRMVCIK